MAERKFQLSAFQIKKLWSSGVKSETSNLPLEEVHEWKYFNPVFNPGGRLLLPGGWECKTQKYDFSVYKDGLVQITGTDNRGRQVIVEESYDLDVLKSYLNGETLHQIGVLSRNIESSEIKGNSV